MISKSTAAKTENKETGTRSPFLSRLKENLMRNHEGYSDPTAGLALKNIMREEKRNRKLKKTKNKQFRKKELGTNAEKS